MSTQPKIPDTQNSLMVKTLSIAVTNFALNLFVKMEHHLPDSVSATCHLCPERQKKFSFWIKLWRHEYHFLGRWKKFVNNRHVCDAFIYIFLDLSEYIAHQLEGCHALSTVNGITIELCKTFIGARYDVISHFLYIC